MGLVDYSDSESETEAVSKPLPPTQPPTAASGTKKPFQKVVDRSKPGKILVSLPGSSSGQADNNNNTAPNGDEPPAKRARTSRGGAFSGFNSFLPPPKNVGKKPTPSASSSSGSGDKGANAPKPGVHLKTGAAPGFIRSTDNDGIDDIHGDEKPAPGGDSGEMSLPAPKVQQPTIPAGQKPADEVKLVGKPLMFRPLSVSRKKPTKKATPKPAVPTPAIPDTPPTPAEPDLIASAIEADARERMGLPTKKAIPLFSLPVDELYESKSKDESNGVYEPLIDTHDTTEPSTEDAFAAYDAQYGSSFAAPAQTATVSSAVRGASNSLDSIASDMNLSAEARRELFGRRGAPSTNMASAKVINFDTEKEYAHNEELRASGEQQIHNPLRGIAPGKHNLRQLVNQVQNQRDALEESFAQGRSKQSEAGSRYGWR